MFTKIPKLTSSTDYPRWARTVTAYLGVQKAWKAVIKSAPAYVKVEDGPDNQDAIDAWEEAEGIARGVIILTLHPTIAEGVDISKPVPEIWASLKEKYGKPGPSGIYAEFKKILETEIPGNADPAHALETIRTSFTKMASLECEVPHKIQVLIYMSKLTHPIYDHMTTSFVAREEIEKVEIGDVDRLCRLAWEQKVSKKKTLPQAAKISAVKPAPKESSFQGQQDKGEGPSRK